MSGLEPGEFIVSGKSYTFKASPLDGHLGHILDEEGDHTGLYAPDQETATHVMVAYRVGLRHGEEHGTAQLSSQLRRLLGAASQSELHSLGEVLDSRTGHLV